MTDAIFPLENVRDVNDCVHARQVRMREVNMERTNSPSVEGGRCTSPFVIINVIFDWLSIQLSRSITNLFKTVRCRLRNHKYAY